MQAFSQVDGLLASDIWQTYDNEPSDIIGELDRLATSPRLAKLHLDLLATSDRADRAPIYRDIEATLLDELPMIPIAWGDNTRPVEVFLVSKRLKGFHDPVTGYGRQDEVAQSTLDR
jgi:ABC-type transport system substrate-binding protein